MNYEGTTREILRGDTVTSKRPGFEGMAGIVYEVRNYVSVAWIKWNPMVEAAMTDDLIDPKTLVLKGRN